MEVEQYLNAWKTLHDHFLDFIDNQNDSQSDYQNLISDFQNITGNKNDFRQLLHLILRISINHHRCSNFYSKIDQILSFLTPKIVQTFSKSEIAEIFLKNKRILLFFNKNKIYDNDPFDKTNENHEEVSEKGENDSYISQLIREDSIEEFIAYIHRSNIPLTSTIKPSNYETNILLIGSKQLTLLEYSFFFGSVQIVNYLISKGIKLTKTLWIYAVHSNNAELIQRLVDENLVPNFRERHYLYAESIKCHHNEVAAYIRENYIMSKDRSYVYNCCFHYLDYQQLSELEVNNAFFLYACRYNYIELVKLLLNDVRIDVNYVDVFPKKKKKILMKLQNNFK